MGVMRRSGMIQWALVIWLVAAPAVYAEAAPAAPHPAIIIDAADGSVLYQIDAMRSWYPASLTKMMTLYLTFKALESGRVKLSDPITVTAHAAAQPPTRLGLRKGETLTLEQAILATATPSATITPRSAPRSRMCRVSARVSTSLRQGIPYRSRNAGRVS